MNTLVSTNLEEVTSARLPPPRRAERARILFLSAYQLGLKTFAEDLIARTAQRDDIDAVHVRLVPPLWMKVLGKSAPRAHGWDLHAYRHMLLWDRVLRRWLTGPLALDRFDAIHVMTQSKGLCLPDLAGRRRIPFVVNTDSTAELEARHFGSSRWARLREIALERRVLSHAALVTCWSRWAADSVRDDYGIAPDRISVSRPGVPMRPPPELNAQATTIAEPIHQPRIAFVGNDWSRKGGPRLLAWHRSRWADRAELHVFSSGASSSRSDTAGRGIVWHGSVPREQLLRDWLPRMDLFVLPTRHDTLVMAAVEAQAAGIPVVASRIGGLPEVVLHGRTGFLCPPADDAAFTSAIDRLLADRPLRQSMGAAARVHAAADWNHARSCDEHLDKIVRVARASRP
jgi:glycosyltransferase involved in cell wall biosynthesis